MNQNMHVFNQSNHNIQISRNMSHLADQYLDKITQLEEEIRMVEKKLFSLLDEYGIDILGDIEL